MRLCNGFKRECCLILAVVLFIAGICFQSFETYSYFERSSQSAEDVMTQNDLELEGVHNYGISAGKASQEVLLDYASRGAQEVSGVRNSSIARAVERCVNVRLRLLLVCSVLTVLSKNIQKERMLARDIEDAGSRFWDFITRYIHLKDGKKPSYNFSAQKLCEGDI